MSRISFAENIVGHHLEKTSDIEAATVVNLNFFLVTFFLSLSFYPFIKTREQPVQ